MAHIETRYYCPVCDTPYTVESDARKCRDQHHIKSNRWAVGKSGKAVLVNENCAVDGMGGLNWALKEADLSDNIEERRKQMESKK